MRTVPSAGWGILDMQLMIEVCFSHSRWALGVVLGKGEFLETALPTFPFLINVQSWNPRSPPCTCAHALEFRNKAQRGDGSGVGRPADFPVMGEEAFDRRA